MNRTRVLVSSLAMAMAVTSVTFAQPPAPQQKPATPPAVERLGPNLFRMGRLRVDTKTQSVELPGKVNDVSVLEFVANTLGGMKAYESAITLDTDAITFNAAMLMIGLDKSHAKVPTRHFDSMAPQGDPVDIWVDWGTADHRQHVRVEQLLFDRRTNATLPEGPWVYTGSTFIQLTGAYMAAVDGVLIGFVHSPAPIIENPRTGAVDAYGAVIFNKNLGLAPLTPIAVTVKAVGAKERPKR